MTTDSYRMFEMNVTKEELNTVTNFCRFLHEIIEEHESFEVACDIVDGIAYNNTLLKELNFKINIEEEK